MGRTVRQKKKNRSSRPTVKQSNKPKKLLNPLGNSIIARNWDKKATLTQNYRRLGLLNRLKTPSGGVDWSGEQDAQTQQSGAAAAPPLAISKAIPGAVREVRVERDANGKIVRVVRPSDAENPLNDPLNEILSDDESDAGAGGGGGGHDGWDGLTDDEEEDQQTRKEDADGGKAARQRENKVADELERMARMPVLKKVRHVGEREAEWLGKLVAKYGDDTEAMARDHRLNPMQQTAAQISKRIGRWRGEH